MSADIDYDKHHLNYNMSDDNLYLTRHIRYNRVGLVNHVVSLARCDLTLRAEHEKDENSTNAALKRIIYNLFSP